MANSSSLAPGFRFHPTDEELLIYYLKRKLLNRPFHVNAISAVNLYKLEPWDLPALARLRTDDQEWFFFCPLDRKYSNQTRTNRATPRGYWKTTGKDREVVRRDSTKSVVGMKKTLVYHAGRAPRGKRTKWVMHEYRLLDEKLSISGVCLDEMVVCRIFEKGSRGPQSGVQVAEEEECEEGLEAQVKETTGENSDCGQDYLQFADLGKNLQGSQNCGTTPCLEEFPSIIQNEQGNLQYCPSIPQDSPIQNEDQDLFNGLDKIAPGMDQSQPSNQANWFFEMNDLSTAMDANLPNCPPQTDEFFDALDGLDDLAHVFPEQTFANENGNENKTFFDAVGSGFDGDYLLDDILENYEGMEGNLQFTSFGTLEQFDFTSSTADFGEPSLNTKELSNDDTNAQSSVHLQETDDQSRNPLVSFLGSYSPPPAFALETVPATLALKFSGQNNYSYPSVPHGKKAKRVKVNSFASVFVRGLLYTFFFLVLALGAACKVAIYIKTR